MPINPSDSWNVITSAVFPSCVMFIYLAPVLYSGGTEYMPELGFRSLFMGGSGPIDMDIIENIIIRTIIPAMNRFLEENIFM